MNQSYTSIASNLMHPEPSFYGNYSQNPYYLNYLAILAQYGNPGVEPADEDSRDVITDALDESMLTADERQAIDKLKEAIALMDEWIANLPDDARLVLDDGDIVTGAEVKEIWAKVDIEIHPSGSLNVSSNAVEIDYNNGDPVILVDLGYLTNTAVPLGQGELLYTLGHELGHVVGDQYTNYSNAPDFYQILANDVARAIADYNGYDLNSGRTYSDSHPQFIIPSPLPFHPSLPGVPTNPYVSPY